MADERQDKTLQQFEQSDGDISDGLGDQLEVDLEDGRVAHQLEVTADKGTVGDGSYANPNDISDLFTRVRVVLNGDAIVDLSGTDLKTLNTVDSGYESTGILKLALGRLEDVAQRFAGIPAHKFNEAKVVLDLAAIGDISDGTTNSGVSVEVTAVQSGRGGADQYIGFTDTVDSAPSSGSRTYNILGSEGGRLRELYAIEEGCTVDKFTIYRVTSTGREKEGEVPARVVREQMQDRAKGAAIDASYHRLPVHLAAVDEAIDFSDPDLQRVEIEAEFSGSGDIRFLKAEEGTFDQGPVRA